MGQRMAGLEFGEVAGSDHKGEAFNDFVVA